MLKDLLNEKRAFKLICGAGNENADEVRELVRIYAKAGCRFFDLSANRDVIISARETLKSMGINDAFICVSVGLKNDPHVSKAQINLDVCKMCGKCEEICPQKAIHNFKIEREKCIGCAKCAKVCKNSAISFYSCAKPLDEILPPVVDLKPDCIELHSIGSTNDEIIKNKKYIESVFDGILSLCISRQKLGNEEMISQIKSLIEGRKPYTTIIQADGIPMTGGKDDYLTTLQAVAAAEIVQNANLPVYLTLSGGTNSKTGELCKMCNIDYNGIAIGSFARKIVKNQDFKTAVNIAEKLIKSTF